VVIGLDIQVRGVACTTIDLLTGAYLSSDWYQINETETERRILETYNCCQFTSNRISKDYHISIAAVEFPTANVSSSSYILWMLAGAAIAALTPFCDICEGIVPSSWKKYSGLNTWAKERNLCKRGIILKQEIKNGIISLDSTIPSDLSPVDLYDSIAIAKGARVRNEERVNGNSKS
jgi:hypothetical protein